MKHFTLKVIVLPAIILLAICACNRSNNFSMVILSDLHYDSTDVREVVLDSVIQRVNTLDQSDIAGDIKFVAVLGDLTNDASKDEWSRYLQNFGLTGDADLKYPVYEIPGNHDGNIDGVVRTGIRERNRLRANINVSENGLHYSWDESGVHFAALGIYPGLDWDPNCEWCHYFHESFRDPEMSLAFLKHDLENNLNKPDQPVILFFHYGWDSFSLLWWTEAEQERFYDLINEYNIAAVFHGHDHAIEHYQWKGIDVWSAGSPQSGDKTGRFLTLSLEGDTMKIFATDINSTEFLNSKLVKR